VRSLVSEWMPAALPQIEVAVVQAGERVTNRARFRVAGSAFCRLDPIGRT